MEDKNPIQVADRLFGALELLAENGDAGVMEVSAALGGRMKKPGGMSRPLRSLTWQIR